MTEKPTYEELEKEILERRHTDKKLSDLNDIFNLLGSDPRRNIDIIVQKACEILEGVASVYNRHVPADGTLVVFSNHNLPEDYEREELSAGRICYEATILGGDRPVALDDLEATPFSSSDPNVSRYGIRSYIGFPVILGEKAIGSLCVVDTKPRKFSPNDIHIITTLGKALSLEEERFRAEAALRESEEKYRSLFEDIADSIFVFDRETKKFVDCNRAALDRYGYTIEDLSSMTPYDLHPPDEHEKVGRNIEDATYQGPHFYIHLTKEGEAFPVEIHTSQINYRGRKAWISIVRDVTERRRAEQEKKRLEAQLQYAQKMEAIGTLAGGIAHNFNNLLMGIQGNVSLMLLGAENPGPYSDRLRAIETLIQDGSKLTTQLLGYARQGKFDVRPINLNLLASATSDAFATTRKEILVHLNLEDDLRGVVGDQGQLEQVLLNLYINAADAMPQGGELFLSSANVTHLEMTGTPYEPRPGNYVLITVRDTGIGMDPKTVERIFEPFFTTKGLVNGTGLGLASAYGIIKAHGGYIDVESHKGMGTTFKIYLPASKEQIIEKTRTSEKVLKGNETILLVDDEDVIIDVGKEILQTMGYRTLTAQNGRDAVNAYETNGKEIDLVILDIVMPGVGGSETYDRLKEIDPGVKVLLSSGYNLDGQAREILERGCNGFIQKPFRIEDLSKKIREILTEG